MNKNIQISVVSPVYKAEKILDELIVELKLTLSALNVRYEIILVDDRSPDNCWGKMKELSTEHDEVKAVRLSKNFGQHPAIISGLSLAKGDWVVVMDCDLQDQPKEIEKLYKKALLGYDVVLAKRKERNDSFYKQTTSYVFSKVYGYFTDTNYDNEVANFGIYKKKVIHAILSMSDYIKFFPLFVKHVGFNTISIEVEHSKRLEGTSSYSFFNLLKLAFNTIISFSNKPLKLVVKLGMLISIFSMLFGVYNIYLSISGEIEVLGYSSIIISIWFLFGVMVTIMGVIGIYLGKIFDQVKQRPVFIIDEVVG